MSKSLYQYKFNPEQRGLLEQVLIQALGEEKYFDKVGNRMFTYGSGWLTAKRRIEYKITGDVLSICIWKVVAPFVPSAEMGCCDISNFYGGALNSSMKANIERIAYKVNCVCPLALITNCQTVDDNFFMMIQ